MTAAPSNGVLAYVYCFYQGLTLPLNCLPPSPYGEPREQPQERTPVPQGLSHAAGPSETADGDLFPVGSGAGSTHSFGQPCP